VPSWCDNQNPPRDHAQQGARLLALRKASGLTQVELAKALDVPQANISFWEWSDKPPRSDLLSTMAKVQAQGQLTQTLVGHAGSSPLISSAR
jgi:DNA-binding transcriptional regulator YiaG